MRKKILFAVILFTLSMSVIYYPSSQNMEILGNKKKIETEILKSSSLDESEIIWQNNSQSSGKAIVVDENGFLYLTGYAGGNNTEVFIAKFNSQGMSIWNRTWGNNGNARVYDMISDQNGHLYIVGSIITDADNQAFILKYDYEGKKLWNITYGISGYKYIMGMSISLDSEGKLYLGGKMGYFVSFLAKFDHMGSQIWNRTNILMLGQVANVKLAIDNDDFIYLAGYLQGYYLNPSSMYLIKYDPEGTEIWNRTIENAGVSVTAIAISPDNSIYVSGSRVATEEFQANRDIFTAKFNSTGDQIWNMTLGMSNITYCEDSITDDSGNIYLAGYTLKGQTNSFNAYVAILNQDGEILWDFIKLTESSDQANSITLDQNGDIFLCGITYNLPLTNAFIYKIIPFETEGIPGYELHFMLLFSFLGLIILIKKISNVKFL